MAKSLRTPAHNRLLELLRASRRAAKLSQGELAARLGKPQSYVAKVELGERRLDVIEFIAFLNAIGHDAMDVLQALTGGPRRRKRPSGT